MEYTIYGRLYNNLVEQVGGKLVLKKSTTEKLSQEIESFDVPIQRGTASRYEILLDLRLRG